MQNEFYILLYIYFMYMSIFIICSNGQVIQNWKYGLPLSPKLYRTDVFKHLVTETVSSKSLVY